MSVAFLFAVLWRRTSGRGIKLILSAGTAFSLGIGVLYYTNILCKGVHYLYVSVLIFVVLALFLLIYSLLDKKEDSTVRVLNYKPVKVTGAVGLVWSLLIIVMIMVYILFN